MEHWNVLLVSHVVAALFVLVIGPGQILRRRRDRIHRTMGYLWVAAMYYVCLSSFWIVSGGHFSWLHGLSAFTLVTVTLGLISAVRRNIREHLGNMVGSYIGTAIAFGFAVAVPGRAIPRLLATDPGTAVFVALLVAGAVAAVYLSLFRAQANGKGRSNENSRSSGNGELNENGQSNGNGRRRPLAAVDRSPADRSPASRA